MFTFCHCWRYINFFETHFSISNHLWRFFVSFSHSRWTMATEKYSLMEIGFFPRALHQFFFSLTKPLLLLVIEMQINGNLSLFSEPVKRECEKATKLLKNPEPCWDYALPSSKGFFTIYLHLSRLEMFFTSEGKRGVRIMLGSVSIATETFRAIQKELLWWQRVHLMCVRCFQLHSRRLTDKLIPMSSQKEKFSMLNVPCA